MMQKTGKSDGKMIGKPIDLSKDKKDEDEKKEKKGSDK